MEAKSTEWEAKESDELQNLMHAPSFYIL